MNETETVIGVGSYTPKPTIGRIVHYRVGESEVNQFIENGYAGNVRKGTILPAMIVNCFGETCVNLKVFGDCSKDAWLTSRCFLTEEAIADTENPGWFWPPMPKLDNGLEVGHIQP